MVKILFDSLTRNTPLTLRLQHHGVKLLDTILSIHSPMQNLVGKRFIFLRPLTIQREKNAGLLTRRVAKKKGTTKTERKGRTIRGRLDKG